MDQIGRITRVFPKISVAVIELNGTLKVGDKIVIKGREDSFEQTVGSMQIEHDSIEKADAGQAVGIKVNNPVREGNLVFKAD